MTLTRRTVLGALPAVFAAPSFAAAQSLRVLNWRHYGTDESWAGEGFEQRTGLGLIHEYYASPDEAFERLEKNGETYDLVVLSAAQVPKAIERGLLEKLPAEAIKSFNALAEPLRRHRFLVSGNDLFGIAWTWGMTGLSRASAKAAHGEFHWSDLWDPKFKARIGLRNNAIDAVEIAALSLGLDPARISDFAPVEERLSKLGGQVSVLWDGEDAWNKAFAEHRFDLAVNWSTAVARARRFFGLPAEFFEPADGAIGWFDCLAVPAKSPRRDGALALIDYLSDDGFLVEWAGRVGAPAPANLSALGKLPKDDPTRQIHRPELISKLRILDAPSEDFRMTAKNIWARVEPALHG